MTTPPRAVCCATPRRLLSVLHRPCYFAMQHSLLSPPVCLSLASLSSPPLHPAPPFFFVFEVPRCPPSRCHLLSTSALRHTTCSVCPHVVLPPLVRVYIPCLLPASRFSSLLLASAQNSPYCSNSLHYTRLIRRSPSLLSTLSHYLLCCHSLCHLISDARCESRSNRVHDATKPRSCRR